MIKSIFWDNDGILVDTEKLYYKASKLTFAKIGIDLTDEMYVQYFLKQSHGTWHLAKELGYSDEKISELRRDRNQLYSRLLETEIEIIDGAESVLNKLYGKIKMGIVTSSRKDHFEIIHKQTGFLKYFDFVITGDDVKNTKPDPEPYIKALQVSGMKKDDCIVVEDSERGLNAALQAGLRCYIIPTHLTLDSDFTGAEKVLNNIKEILSLI
ncbi:MAG TPA: HAD family phosphatase [Melioribacteraceae bacterium]|nr:HAD family phosphatase [Melioribacteraceae bacterium]